jgi:hypothetical protein
MSIYAYIVAAVMLLVTGAGFGVKWEKGQNALRQQEARQEADRMRAKRENNVDTSAGAHEADKRELQTQYVVITERIEDAKQTDFYAPGAPACLDDAGVRIVNAAALGYADAASQPARAVPGPAAAAQRSAGNGS